MGKLKDIVVFTDGSCSNNGRVGSAGGVGVHFPDGELSDLSHIYKQRSCTNQRTELYAIIIAIKYIKRNLNIKDYNIYIKTDSMYSVNCITIWINDWLNNGWKTKSGTDVANRDLIERLYYYYTKYSIFLIHVMGHTGQDDEDSIANNIADRLATEATKRSIMKRKKHKSGSKKSRQPTIELVKRKKH